jgi:predicted histone-like DNA-binding protein
MIEYSTYMATNHLSPDETAKAYAAAQIREKLSTDKFVSHVASHNSVFSKGTIKGVLADVACCLREQLLNGNKVELEGLGTFGFTLSSQAANSLTEFTAANIKKVNVIFTPDSELENLIKDAVFTTVPSRVAQAAVLKAEKNGDASVDMEAIKKK